MLDLLEIFRLLLKVFVYSVVVVTSAIVIYALLDLWLDKGHKSHSARLTS
jgi:hypothetical protein